MKQIALDTFNEIKMFVKQPENYQKRPYKSIGGMWTVDTWYYKGCYYKLMDEGWSEEIIFNGKRVCINWYNNTITYVGCAEAELFQFANNYL